MGVGMLKFIRDPQTVFQNGSDSLHSHQQHVKIQVAPYTSLVFSHSKQRIQVPHLGFTFTALFLELTFIFPNEE